MAMRGPDFQSRSDPSPLHLLGRITSINRNQRNARSPAWQCGDLISRRVATPRRCICFSCTNHDANQNSKRRGFASR